MARLRPIFHTDTHDQPWRADAACIGADTKTVFYPGNGGTVGRYQPITPEAQRLCGGCPVRQDCLDYALAVPERFGVWGGLNVNERHTIALQRARDARRTA